MSHYIRAGVPYSWHSPLRNAIRSILEAVYDIDTSADININMDINMDMNMNLNIGDKAAVHRTVVFLKNVKISL